MGSHDGGGCAGHGDDLCVAVSVVVQMSRTKSASSEDIAKVKERL